MRLKEKRAITLLAFIFFVLASLGACNVAHWRLSGEALDAVGQQFLTTGKLYDQLFEQGSMTPAEYRPWAVFAEKFKVIYEPAVKVWLAARNTNEKADAADIVIAVKNELLAFYLAALAKKEGTGGGG